MYDTPNGTATGEEFKLHDPQQEDLADLAEQLAECHPEIPMAIYEKLPPTLADLMPYFAIGYQRDTFLTASLGVLSSIVSRAVLRHADGWIGLNLYTLITASAGSGKGAAGYARRYINVTDKRIYEASKEEAKAWRIRRKNGDDNGEPCPPIRSAVLAGNISARALVDSLESSGGAGLIFDTETATVTDALRQDWGNTLPVYLNAWYGETVSIDRKGGEKIRIERPCLAMVLTGTPEAARTLIPSAEDGLFSRFIHYTFQAPPVWCSHRAADTFDEREVAFTLEAAKMDRLHQALHELEKPLCLYLSNPQWDEVDKIFGDTLAALHKSKSSPLLYASVKRSAVIAARIAAILTIIRHWDRNEQIPQSLPVSDIDVWIGTTLAYIYLSHAITLAAGLAHPARSKLSGMQMRFFNELPEGIFGPEEYTEVAQRVGIQARTARKYLTILQEEGMIENIGYGRYLKNDSVPTVPSMLTGEV